MPKQQMILLDPAPTRLVDFTVSNGGSVWLFHPLTSEAQDWWNDNVDPDALNIGGAFAVEHRFAPEIADAIIAEGFETYPPARRT